MNLKDATAECRRWLDHLDLERKKAESIQRIASDVRQKKITREEGKDRLRRLDMLSVKVYDGAKLAEAIETLLHLIKLSAIEKE